MRFMLLCKYKSCPPPLHFWHSPSPYSLLCRKIIQYGPDCHNRNMYLRLAVKVDRLLCFDATLLLHVVTLGLLLLALKHLVHQTCRHILNCRIFHRHRLQGGDRVLIRPYR